MAGPYRESDVAAIECPRCSRAMPPGAIAACGWGCGVWVNADTAGDVFIASELEKSRLATWFRQRVACPHCSSVMTLRGYDMSLFQGCDEHGFWVDDETVGQTGLARPASAARIERARVIAKARRLEQEAREAEERAAREAEKQGRGAEWEAMEARMRAAAAEEERLRQERIRTARLQPFITLVKSIEFRPDELAEYLMNLEDTVKALRKRVDELERG